MNQNWRISSYKKNHLVIILGFTVLLVGFGFTLLFSQSSNVKHDTNINGPDVENDVKLVSLDFAEAVKGILAYVVVYIVYDMYQDLFFLTFVKLLPWGKINKNL